MASHRVAATHGAVAVNVMNGGSAADAAAVAAATAHVTMLSFLEQPFSDDGVMPRLAFAAARGGHVDMLGWMLDKGVNKDRANRHGEQLIHFAAAAIGRQVTSKILCKDNGTDALADAPAAEAAAATETAAETAAEEGAVEGAVEPSGGGANGSADAGSAMVALLLARGAAVDGCTVHGVTALHLVAANGDAKSAKAIVELAMARGGETATNALLKHKTMAGQTCLDLAKLKAVAEAKAMTAKLKAPAADGSDGAGKWAEVVAFLEAEFVARGLMPVDEEDDLPDLDDWKVAAGGSAPTDDKPKAQAKKAKGKKKK